MRIATSMIFNSGVNTINSKTANLLQQEFDVEAGLAVHLGTPSLGRSSRDARAPRRVSRS